MMRFIRCLDGVLNFVTRGRHRVYHTTYPRLRIVIDRQSHVRDVITGEKRWREAWIVLWGSRAGVDGSASISLSAKLEECGRMGGS